MAYAPFGGMEGDLRGDSSEAAWRRIYDVNRQVISDPNHISPGELIYIPALFPFRTLCNVIVNTLNVRTAPTSQSSLVASYPRGTVLNYVDIVLGDAVGNLPLWGRSEQGHYFWLGGTDYSTPGQVGFAATVGSSGNPVTQDAQGGNLTTIHSPVDRPVAKFTQTTLNVPPRAKGVVYIQNDSANPQTVVSNTPNGFASFTIAPNTSTSLLFRRVGTFQAYLNGYPLSADTTLTIIITMPYPD